MALEYARTHRAQRNESGRKSAQKLTSKERRKGYELKKHYGITFVQFAEMLARQEGKCAICGEAPVAKSGTGGTLHVDHNHATGKVRELLCWGCNTSLGKMKESKELLMKAIAYLEKHQ